MVGEKAQRTGPVAGAFLMLGLFWGTWAVLVANIQRTFHLNDGTLGIVLAIAVALAGATSWVVGHRAERFGTKKMLSISLLVWGVLLIAAAIAPFWPGFAVAFCAAECAGGCVDTAMNAAASIRLAGRPGALVRFHSLFNSGALFGALCTGLVLWGGISWRFAWPGVALFAFLGAAWTWRSAGSSTQASIGRDGTTNVGSSIIKRSSFFKKLGSGPITHLRKDGLLLFLAIFSLAEITEGGVDTWGVLYLRKDLAAGILLGAGAYVVGQSVAAITRGAGGPLLGRLEARTALILGGFLAAGGIVTLSLTKIHLLAALGLAAGAGGASFFWPLVMSQATRKSSSPTSAVGAFTAAGYVGWVAGAPVVGWISDTWGPARGLQLLALMAGAVGVISLIGRLVAPKYPQPKALDSREGRPPDHDLPAKS